MVYRREIDGLRAVAVLPVLLFHAGFETFGGGFVGVDVFFVISGYLITALILEEKDRGSFTLRGFYERRARRILPALFFVMLCCLPFAWLWLLPNALDDLADSMIAVSAFVSNVHFHRETGYFAPAAEEQILLHTWSLAVEEQFYLLFPLLILLFWSRGKRVLIGLIVVLGLLSLLTAQFGGHFFVDGDLSIPGETAPIPFTAVPDFAFYLLPTRAWELLAGSLAAFHLHGRGPNRPGSDILAAIGLALILYAVLAFDERTPHPSFMTLLPVTGTALIILFGRADMLTARLLSMPPIVGLGLISYSVYLWHQPLFAFARIRSEETPSAAAFLLLILASLLLGWLTWRHVERPFRDRLRFTRKQIARYSTASAALVFGIGLIGHEFDGFIERYPPEHRDLILAADKKQMGRYVYSRYKAYRNQPFAEDGRLKLLVIGDSFGQDVVNMLAETGALDHVSLSIHEIASPCGNLYLEDDFTGLIEAQHLNRCRRDGWYRGDAIQERLKEADVILLASRWSAWVAERLPESVDNIKSRSDARILLFGTKNFGKIDRLAHLDRTDQEKRASRNPIDREHAEINRRMAERHPDDDFVDLMTMACGEAPDCPLFTPDLKLISYDGDHLTREGAIFLGEKLLMHPLVVDALGLDYDDAPARTADRR